jgi:hypothetical protein
LAPWSSARFGKFKSTITSGETSGTPSGSVATPGKYRITCRASRRTELLVSTCEPCRSTTTFRGSPVATKASSRPRANAITPMNTATTNPTLKTVITVLKTRTRRFRML